MNQTIKGRLQYGCQDENGVWHKDFAMRLATLEDVEGAIEDALTESDAPSPARIQRHQWARTLTSLGSLPKESISAELLSGLEATEYGILKEAQEELRKKLEVESLLTVKKDAS